MLSPVFMRARWLLLVLALASAQATILSLPSAPPPPGGPCQQTLQTATDRLLALEAGLESKSESLLALRLTFDRVFHLLNLDERKLSNGSGFSVDGQGNATVIKVVTLGPTHGRGAVEGSALSGDDEDLDVTYRVGVELEQNTSLEDDNKPSNDDRDQETNLMGSGLPSDDEGLKSYLEGSGLPSDDDYLEGSGLPSDDEDWGTSLEGSGKI